MKKLLLLLTTLALAACGSTPEPTDTETLEANAALSSKRFELMAVEEQLRINHAIEMFNKIAMNQCGETGVNSFNQTGKFLYIYCERRTEKPHWAPKKFTIQIRD